MLRKAWLKFFICTLAVILLLSLVMPAMFYNTSISYERDRAQVVEDFVRDQRLDLIKNIVNSTIAEISMQNYITTERDNIEKDDAYNLVVDAVQRYLDVLIPLGDVEIRIDALDNYSGEGNFATRIITPYFQQNSDYYINAENADYFDVLDLLIQNGEAYTEFYLEGQLERIIYARLYRPFDWIVSSSVSASDIQQLSNMLTDQFREQQSGYIISSALLCLMFAASAIAIFIILGRIYFKKADKEYQVMYDLSHVDALTQVFNRRYLDETLQNIIGFLSRVKNGELSMLMIDVDHFKEYNDTYGHEKGDECLKAVAQALAGVLYRVTDVTARYGGEEFAVILPYTGRDGAKIVAEKLLRCIRALEIPHKKNSAAPYVTISIGVMSVDVEYKHDYKDYIKRADEAMYISKNRGRNRYTYLDFDTSKTTYRFD